MDMESELKFTPRRFNDEEIDLLKEIYARVDRMHSTLQKFKGDFMLQKIEPKPLEKIELLEPVLDLQIVVELGKGNAPEGVVVEEKLNLPLRNMVEHLVCPKEEVSLMYFSKENPTKELQVKDYGLLEQNHKRLELVETQNKASKVNRRHRISDSRVAKEVLGVRKISVKRRYHRARKKKSWEDCLVNRLTTVECFYGTGSLIVGGKFLAKQYHQRTIHSTQPAHLQKTLLRKRTLDIHFSIPKENLSERGMNQGTLEIFKVGTTIANDELLKLFVTHGEIREITETPNRRFHMFIEYCDVGDAETALKALIRSDRGGTCIKLELNRHGGARPFLALSTSPNGDRNEVTNCSNQVASEVTNSPPGGLCLGQALWDFRGTVNSDGNELRNLCGGPFSVLVLMLKSGRKSMEWDRIGEANKVSEDAQVWKRNAHENELLYIGQKRMTELGRRNTYYMGKFKLAPDRILSIKVHSLKREMFLLTNTVIQLEDKLDPLGASNSMWRMMSRDIRKTQSQEEMSEFSLANQVWEPGGKSFKELRLSENGNMEISDHWSVGLRSYYKECLLLDVISIAIGECEVDVVKLKTEVKQMQRNQEFLDVRLSRTEKSCGYGKEKVISSLIKESISTAIFGKVPCATSFPNNRPRHHDIKSGSKFFLLLFMWSYSHSKELLTKGCIKRENQRRAKMVQVDSVILGFRSFITNSGFEIMFFCKIIELINDLRDLEKSCLIPIFRNEKVIQRTGVVPLTLIIILIDERVHSPRPLELSFGDEGLVQKMYKEEGLSIRSDAGKAKTSRKLGQSSKIKEKGQGLILRVKDAYDGLGNTWPRLVCLVGNGVTSIEGYHIFENQKRLGVNSGLYRIAWIAWVWDPGESDSCRADWFTRVNNGDGMSFLGYLAAQDIRWRTYCKLRGIRLKVTITISHGFEKTSGSKKGGRHGEEHSIVPQQKSERGQMRIMESVAGFEEYKRMCFSHLKVGKSAHDQIKLMRFLVYEFFHFLRPPEQLQSQMDSESNVHSFNLEDKVDLQPGSIDKTGLGYGL